MRFRARGGRTLKVLTLLPTMSFLVGALIVAGATFAASSGTHKHKDGLELLGNKLGTNGNHEVHKTAGHTVHAQVSNKKVAQITVTGSQGDVPVTKYKLKDYIGYAFTDGVDTYFYWFSLDGVDGSRNTQTA
jgi:hypothetical protein